MFEGLIAWLLFLALYLLPLAHVVLSPRAGSWHAPAGAGCPLGPRAGWLVMVLFLGPLGWLLFYLKRGVRS